MTRHEASLRVCLQGRWTVERYTVGTKTYVTRGMILLTPTHLLSTVVFDIAPGHRRASANSGPYTIEHNDLVMIQDMQLHYDSADSAEHLLTEGVAERIACHLAGDTLILRFPSGNLFDCRRAAA